MVLFIDIQENPNVEEEKENKEDLKPKNTLQTDDSKNGTKVENDEEEPVDDILKIGVHINQEEQPQNPIIQEEQPQNPNIQEEDIEEAKERIELTPLEDIESLVDRFKDSLSDLDMTLRTGISKTAGLTFTIMKNNQVNYMFKSKFKIKFLIEFYSKS